MPCLSSVCRYAWPVTVSTGFRAQHIYCIEQFRQNRHSMHINFHLHVPYSDNQPAIVFYHGTINLSNPAPDTVQYFILCRCPVARHYHKKKHPTDKGASAHRTYIDYLCVYINLIINILLCKYLIIRVNLCFPTSYLCNRTSSLFTFLTWYLNI